MGNVKQQKVPRKKAAKMPGPLSKAFWAYTGSDGIWVMAYIALEALMQECLCPYIVCVKNRETGKFVRTQMGLYMTAYSTREGAGEATAYGLPNSPCVIKWRVYLSPEDAARFQAEGSFRVLDNWLKDQRHVAPKRKRGAGGRRQPYDGRTGRYLTA